MQSRIIVYLPKPNGNWQPGVAWIIRCIHGAVIIPRSKTDGFLANFKPMRGNYSDDGGKASIKVATYDPNGYGCMIWLGT